MTCVLGATVSLSVVAVVPFDVWQALVVRQQQQDHEEELALSLLHRSWAAIYWSIAFLCHVLCPVLMGFEAAGDFTVGRRLRTSLRRNAAFCVAYVLFGILLLAWLLLRGTVQGDLESWCIAASNAWGLLLLTVLMGFGLVAVPRHLWQLADPGEQLKSLYILALVRDEARLSKLFELQDAMEQLRAELTVHAAATGQPGLAPSGQRALQLAVATARRTLARCEEVYGELTRASRSLSEAGSPSQGACGGQWRSGGSEAGTAPRSLAEADVASRLENFARLHCALKVAGLEARRAACRWDSHVQRCIFLEDLEDRQFKAAAELLSLLPRGGLARGPCACLQHAARACLRRALALWLRALRARVLRSLSCGCGLLSVVIVLGQLTMFAERWSLSLLSLLFRRDHGPWLTQAMCVVPLGYMTYTAYFSIFRVRIAGWYGLYGNHNTDTGSLLWCVSVLARLVAPLCYHFLMLIRVQGTTFQAFMGKMSVVPVLGESLNELFPCLVAVLCCLNLLNPYSRIVQCLSMGIIELEAAGGDSSDPLSEGKQLVERERRRRAEESSLELRSRSTPERLAVPLAAPVA